MLVVNGKFEIIENKKECFDEEVFIEKYSEVFDRYELILGDISDKNLRLKGFTSKKVKNEQSHVDYMPLYMYEHVKYGAKYFLLRRVKTDKNTNNNNNEKNDGQKNQNKRRRPNKNKKNQHNQNN